MAGFFSALLKQRKEAKKNAPNTRERFNEIVGILRKYDYDDGITPEVVVNILQDLGPTFVKIGQIASQQSEQIPPDYCDALAGLRSSVAPMDIQIVRAQIEKHLGKPTGELFASFDDEPLGSASIGQVHRAELFDGTVVAVKVRRPGVVDTVARDFALLERIIDRFAKDGIGGVDVRTLILELEKTSKQELDFTNEAANIEQFAENNADRARIDAPLCYRDLTNEAILTEDFVTGHEVGNADYLATLDDDERDRLAELVADNFATQVLVDGFYHADPHSGNLFVQEPVDIVMDDEQAPDAADEDVPEVASEQVAEAADEDVSGKKDGDKVALPDHGVMWIDFGMMGMLSTQQRQLLVDLVSAMVMKNAYALKRTVLKCAHPKGDIDHGALLELCEDMCAQYDGSDFGDFYLGDLLSTILASLQEENYRIEPFLTNLSRGVIAIEGTVKTLSPRVNILNNFMDKVDAGLSLDASDLSMDTISDAIPTVVMGLMKYIDDTGKATAKTAETLDMLEKGQVKVRTDLSFEEKAFDLIERLVSLVLRALMIIALFIGSCLLCTAPPATFAITGVSIDFPAIGFIGYLLSVFLAWCLYRDMKSGR